MKKTFLLIAMLCFSQISLAQVNHECSIREPVIGLKGEAKTLSYGVTVGSGAIVKVETESSDLTLFLTGPAEADGFVRAKSVDMVTGDSLPTMSLVATMSFEDSAGRSIQISCEAQE